MLKKIIFMVNNKKSTFVTVCSVVSLFFVLSLLLFAKLSPSLNQTDYGGFKIIGHPIIGCTGKSVGIEKSFSVGNEDVNMVSLNTFDSEKEFENIKKNDEVQINFKTESTTTTSQVTQSTNQNVNSQSKSNLDTNKTETKTVQTPAKGNSYDSTRNTNLLKTVEYNPEDTFESHNFTNYNSLGNFKLTYYCACQKCCEKPITSPNYGITATGTKVTEGRTIAVDPRVIPYGSKVYIEGLGVFIAEDCGGAIKYNRIDIFKQSHSECYKMTLLKAAIYIIED